MRTPHRPAPPNSRAHRAFLLSAILASLACTAGCREPAPPPGAAGPVEAVRGFAAALGKGDTASAWALLSARTQREADAIASAVRAASDAGPASGRQMLFSSALPQGKVTAREISRKSDAAEIAVTDPAGRTQTYRAVRDGDLWKIDLDLKAR